MKRQQRPWVLRKERIGQQVRPGPYHFYLLKCAVVRFQRHRAD